MRTITVPAGLGDSLWLIMKLINSGEKFNFVLPGNTPRRGKQIFDLLPQIANSAEYGGDLPYKKIKINNAARREGVNWKSINATEIYLSCNEHLEAGKKLSSFLPDLPTTYIMDYQTSNMDKNTAYEVLLSSHPVYTRFIGIYCSSYAGSKNWGTWQENEWFELIKFIHTASPNSVFVVIGAQWDVDLSSRLLSMLFKEKIPMINTVGSTLGTTIEILKRLHYFIGFPSGLSIINESLGKPGLMFYSNAISKIINTWANPDRIANGDIKECLFCEPSKIFDWLYINNKI